MSVLPMYFQKLSKTFPYTTFPHTTHTVHGQGWYILWVLDLLCEELVHALLGEVLYIKAEFFCPRCQGECVEQRVSVACYELTLIMAKRGQHKVTDQRRSEVVQRRGVRNAEWRVSFGRQGLSGALYRSQYYRHRFSKERAGKSPGVKKIFKRKLES